MARFAFSGGFFFAVGFTAVLAVMKFHAAFATDEFYFIYYHIVVIFLLRLDKCYGFFTLSTAEIEGLTVLQHLGRDPLSPLLQPLEVPLPLPEVVGQHLWYGLHRASDGIPATTLGAD